MATTPNYSWPTPDNTAYVKDGASAMRNLGNAIDSTTKTVSDAAAAAQSTANTANTTANAAIPKSLVDAKGDLVVATANDTVTRLAVGANGTVLTADSSAAGGVKWATAAAGDTWTLITSTTPSAAATTVQFSGLGGSYTKLWVICTNVTKTASNQINLTINNNTTAAVYNQTYTYFTTIFNMDNNIGASFKLERGTGTTGHYSSTVIANASQSVPKTLESFSSTTTTYTKDNTGFAMVSAPITSIELICSTSSFAGAGTIYLYGVAA